MFKLSQVKMHYHIHNHQHFKLNENTNIEMFLCIIKCIPIHTLRHRHPEMNTHKHTHTTQLISQYSVSPSPNDLTCFFVKCNLSLKHTVLLLLCLIDPEHCQTFGRVSCPTLCAFRLSLLLPLSQTGSEIPPLYL